jgi:ribonucleoside-diphosphate reductase subunit M2
VKKLIFDAEDKENMPVTAESIESLAKPALDIEKTPTTEVQEQAAQQPVPKTLKELEKEEPLLQENPHRFVLFPLKYHEIVRSLLPFLPLPRSQPLDFAGILNFS